MSNTLRNRNDEAFQQLVLQLESKTDAEREQMLATIGTRDPAQAALLKVKILTLERVFSWDRNSLAKIFLDLDPFTIASLFAASSGDAAIDALPESIQIKIGECLALIQPDDDEIETAKIKLFLRVRELERQEQIFINESQALVAFNGAHNRSRSAA
jgi:hypothetical protein